MREFRGLVILELNPLRSVRRIEEEVLEGSSKDSNGGVVEEVGDAAKLHKKMR